MKKLASQNNKADCSRFLMWQKFCLHSDHSLSVAQLSDEMSSNAN